MEKLLFLSIGFLLALFFYVIIPGIGAIIARDYWKKFRMRLIENSMLPILEYSNINPQPGIPSKFRLFGTIEAIQGENRIWITNGRFTVAAELGETAVYILPSLSGFKKNQHQDSYLAYSQNFEPTVLQWHQLYSIAEGTRIFIAGTLFQENNRLVFKPDHDYPLMVIIYDGDQTTVLNRAILSGRKRNEYWNHFTRASLVSGMVSLLLFSIFLLTSADLRFVAVVSISLGLLPVWIFMPPGLVLLYYYRIFWTKARDIRAGRDLVVLPLRYIRYSRHFIADKMKQIILLPDNTEYIMHKSSLADNLKLVKPPDQVQLRQCYYTRKEMEESPATYLFGRFIETSTGYFITKPTDPMLELVLIPGDPELIIHNCRKKSGLLVTLAIVLLCLDIIINFYMVNMILQFLARYM